MTTVLIVMSPILILIAIILIIIWQSLRARNRKRARQKT
jgi:heme/copper-type cytochrome/quinol oxidase subunit 2